MFAGCYGDNYWGGTSPDDENCLTPEGAIISKTAEENKFTEIQIAGEWGKQAYVTIEKGERYEVTITGKENLVEAMAVNSRNNVLEISMTECFNDVSKLKIHITAPALERVSNYAWGAEIQVKGFEGESLSISNDEFSHLDFDIHYKSVKINSSGSGKFTLTGQADKLEGVFRTHSYMKGFGLETKEADITSSTPLDIEVKATEKLTARITDSGNIRYKGHPAISEAITGTGKVIDAN
jgi:hypothetical protein